MINIHNISETQHETTKEYFGISKNYRNNEKIFGTITNTIGKLIFKNQTITHKTNPKVFKTNNPHNIYQTNNTNNQNFQKQKSNKTCKNNLVNAYLNTKLLIKNINTI